MQVRDHLFGLFQEYVHDGLKFVRRHLKEYVTSVDINLVTTLTKFLQSLLRIENKINLNQPLDDLRMVLNRVFAFSYVWALGGNIREESLEEFSEHVREKLAVLVNFPPAGLVFDFKLSIQEPAGGAGGSGGPTIVDIVSWQHSIPEYTYNPATPYFEILVPTIDTVRRGRKARMLCQGIQCHF